jgi:hypothetical protein
MWSMGTSNNVDTVVRRLQQRFVGLQRCVLGLDVLLGAMVAGFLATVSITLLGWAVPLRLAYGAILAGAVVVFGLLAWRIRLPALPALIRADHALHLREQLSTAYEYRQHHPNNPFVPPLVAVAEQLATQVDLRLVFPRRVPRRAWGIPVFLAALVGFSTLHVAPMHFDEPTHEPTSQEAARQGERLERWGRRLEQLAQQKQLDRSAVLARHMQELGRRLQREGGESAQVAQRIANLSQYLQRMQQELQERTLMSDAGLMAAHDVLASGKSVKQELRDILQLLQHNTLPRESAAVAEQGLMRLRRQVGQNPELEQMLQSLRAGNVEAARQLLQDILQNQQASEEMEHLERARRALEYSTRSIQRGESGESPTSNTPHPGEMANHNGMADYDAEMMSEHMSGMEDFGTPGAEEGFGTSRYSREAPQQPLRESEQPASQVPVKSGEGAMRLSYARSLPLQNEARVPLEQVTVRYQRAAEEVLAQEHIPRDYREQIKQYFLAIGMVPEVKP